MSDMVTEATERILHSLHSMNIQQEDTIGKELRRCLAQSVLTSTSVRSEFDTLPSHSYVLQCVLITPVLEKWRQLDSWGLWDSQPSSILKLSIHRSSSHRKQG